MNIFRLFFCSAGGRKIPLIHGEDKDEGRLIPNLLNDDETDDRVADNGGKNI